VFCWVPDHTGLRGNTASDAVAKVPTLHRNLVSDRALGSGICTFLHHAVLSSWQDKWTSTRSNKLCLVKLSIRPWHSSLSAVRKEKVMLTYL
jgi:hypothetical protein